MKNTAAPLLLGLCLMADVLMDELGPAKFAIVAVAVIAGAVALMKIPNAWEFVKHIKSAASRCRRPESSVKKLSGPIMGQMKGKVKYERT